jgi:hypothetical protein
MLIPVLTPDIQVNIEEELRDDEHAHAIPFCAEHHHPEFMPVSGTIVQAMCKQLFRFNRLSTDTPKCTQCSEPMDSNCYVCGKELYG